jgi:hemerythrin-like metal-binding protein
MTQYLMTDWSDDYLIGIEMLDEQHKKFFRLAHHFFNECLADEGEENISSALKGLGSYIIKHFFAEEAFMDKIGYPRLEEHKQLHAQFLTKYYEMEKELNELGPSEKLVNKILSTLMSWLKEHIASEDSDYAKFKAGRYVARDCRDNAVSIVLQLKNRLDEIDRALQSFTEFCKPTQLDNDIQNSVSIVLDDLLNNVISYGFEDSNEHEIEVYYRADHQRLVIEIVDDGVAFDPFLKGEPDIESDIDERGIGGLGIHMIKSIMDDYFYKRINGRNHVTLMKRMGD